MDPKWLRWVKRLQAIAQDGLTYATDDYDVGRYEQLREIAAEILASRSTGELEDACALLELEKGPATPKVDVRAAVIDGDRILLVKEPEDGSWSPPGGWADVGETASEAAVREVHEESGYRVRPMRLICAYDRDRHEHPPIPYHVFKVPFSTLRPKGLAFSFLPSDSCPGALWATASRQVLSQVQQSDEPRPPS